MSIKYLLELSGGGLGFCGSGGVVELIERLVVVSGLVIDVSGGVGGHQTIYEVDGDG